MPDHPFSAPNHVSDAIQRMPKCNLHTHLEGSVRPATLVDLAREQGLSLPAPEGQIDDALQVNGTEKDLAGYLAKIALVYPVLKDAAALRRVAREAAEDAARANVRYLELRAGPATHASPDLPVRDVIAAMLAGLADAEAQLGITCRLIVAALRHHAPETNIELARTALEFRGAGVVGFDLAGDEARFPARLHREAIDLAREGGLGITIHAGEAGGADEVEYAVDVLGATRIGHGVHAIENPHTVRMLVERDVTLEMCPTSNVHTGAVASIERHPIDAFIRQGVAVTIGDDDPTTSRTDVGRELMLLQQVFGYDLDQLARFGLRGIQSSFLGDDGADGVRRARLLSEFGVQ